MAELRDYQRALAQAESRGDAEAVEYFAAKVQELQPAKPGYNRMVEAGRKATKGLTLGWGDEIGGGIAALGVVGTTDKTLSDLPQVYGEIMDRMAAQESSYEADHPVEATLAEVAGGVGTGVAGGLKFAGSKLGQKALANAPMWASAAGVGAAEGGIYGAGESEDRLRGGLQGAAIGGVMAPVGGAIVQKGGDVLGSITRWAKNKLTDTPKKQAIRAIRQALESSGMDPEEAVHIYSKLGKEATMADIDETFRATARAAVDVPGPAKSQARAMMNSRQMGQQSRLLEAAENAVGKRADDLAGTVASIAERRSQAAGPAYRQAFDETPIIDDEALIAVLDRPAMKSAMRKAKSFAENLGESFEPGSLEHLHYAKMALDKTLKQQKFPRDLMKLKTDLLRAMDDASPLYKQARDQFAGESELLDAAELGRKFLKTAPDELQASTVLMTQGEREMYELGAMAGIQDLFDRTQFTHDAARKLINNNATLKRLATVFGDEQKAKQFLTAAWREGEMGRTRAVLTGGSPTAERLAGQKWLEDSVQPETVMSFIQGDPTMAAVFAAAKEIFGKKPLSAQALGEIGDILIKQGMSEGEVRKILTAPKTMQFLTNFNQEFVTRAGTGGAVAPFAGNTE